MLSSNTVILLKTIRTKPILASLGKPVGKRFDPQWYGNLSNDFFLKLLDLDFNMVALLTVGIQVLNSFSRYTLI